MNQNERLLPYLEAWGSRYDCKDRCYSKQYKGEKTLPRPNVIWVIADQMRADALSCNGSTYAITPNLDRLARYGMNFNRAVAAYPVCSAFRGALFCGQHHHKCVLGHQYGIADGQRTVADVFNDAGYDTAFFGKWHIDCRSDNSPYAYVPESRRGGFKTWLGYDNNGMQWAAWVHGNYRGKETRFKLNGFESDAMTDIFIGYLKEQMSGANAQPLFAVLSLFAPHPPYMAPARNFSGRKTKVPPNVPRGEAESFYRSEMPRYAAMVENVDENIGRIMDALSELEADMNTHIVFMSDHGDMFGAHGLYEKLTPFEESVRIPFIIGGAVPYMYGFRAGETDALINEEDIAPTTLGLCGIRVPDWMDGFDYSYRRFGTGDPPREPDSAYIKAIVPSGYLNKAWRGVITRNGWKYACFEDAPYCLFDLNSDLHEEVNLLYRNGYEGRQRELHALLQKWIDTTQDYFSLPELPRQAAVGEAAYRPIKVKFLRAAGYNTDCDRMETLLELLGVSVTEEMEKCDVYLSLDGVLHAYGNAEKTLSELQEAERLGKRVVAVCMTQTTEISKMYRDRKIPFARLEEGSLAAALFLEER